MSVELAPQFTRRNYFWTEWKIIRSLKSLNHQYDDDGQMYTIWGYDGPEAHFCTIWKGTVPDGVITSGYSQSQNDSDKSDFENNFKSTANSRVSNDINQRTVLNNATITVGGSQIFSGNGDRQISLFINVTQSPTGTNPGLQFTLQELDPGNQTTTVGTSVTGASITASGTQTLTLNLTTSSTIKVSWIIVGTDSPSFPGVYATLTSKPTTVFSGVDFGGTERVVQPDSSGRLMVVGSTAPGGAGVGNPLLMGGVTPAGTVAYSTLSSDSSTIVVQGVNKQPIFINGTVTSDGISNIVSLGVPIVHLFINIKNAPTGINPSITFTMHEVDPGDQSTLIGTSITGDPIISIGTQMLTLPLTTSGFVQVSWTVTGDTPSFTGIYVTASMKTNNMVVGSSAVGSQMIGNPVITGTTDPSGNVRALSSKLLNGLNNTLVYDEEMSNKLDQIILLLMDIRDKKLLGE